MCQPARASILTGKLPYSHGVRDNGRDLEDTLVGDGLAGIFGGAGYTTHFIGKAHFATHETFAATGQAECYNSVGSFPADWEGPYFGFQKVQLTLQSFSLLLLMRLLQTRLRMEISKALTSMRISTVFGEV